MHQITLTMFAEVDGQRTPPYQVPVPNSHLLEAVLDQQQLVHSLERLQDSRRMADLRERAEKAEARRSSWWRFWHSWHSV